MREISVLIGGAVAHCKVVRETGRVVALGTPAGVVWLPRWALIPEGSYYRLSCRYALSPEEWRRLESAQWVSGFSI